MVAVNWLVMAGGLTRRVGERVWRLALHNPTALLLAGVILLSTVSYTAGVLLNEARYRLDGQSQQLIGAANLHLAKKLKLDRQFGSYRFNAESITPEMTGESDPAKVAALLANQKQQAGGGGEKTENLYSLDLPLDPKKGTTVYDSNSKTSFKIVPQFDIDTGRSENGRIVYPLQAGGQAIYTVKGNGVKEDIVLSKPRGDALKFQYRLELPSSLTARLDARGNLGIYGVDPVIARAAAGTTGDTARLKDIQQNGEKNHLVYLIPTPTIAQSGAHPHGHTAKAMYRLNGDQLTVETTGLETLTYPISIDPSVVVTSTSDFTAGNNEGMIQFDAGAISRAGATGGTVGAWTSTSALPQTRSYNSSVSYNGFLYVTGGIGDSSNNVRYAPLNADGTVGVWAGTSNMNTTRYAHTSVAYNGFLYAIGGTASSAKTNSVEFARLNTDGSVGAWASTTSLGTARDRHVSVVYNGYIYAIGGNDSTSAALNSVEYAPLNADGTVGSWASTTALPQAIPNASTAVYNGYVYIMGGIVAGGSASVRFAPLNADGTVGAWTNTTSFSTGRYNHGSVVYNGYLYVIGGTLSSGGGKTGSVECAPLNADGTVGAWVGTTSLSVARDNFGVSVYNGYVYAAAGSDSANAALSGIEYTKIDPPKQVEMTAWATTTAFGALGQQSKNRILTRSGHSSVVYNGYIYLIGGSNTVSPFANVDYAPLNADGTVGAWVATTALPSGRAGHASVAYNGYVYAFGGQDNPGAITATSYYAPLNADGTVGAWAITTALPVASSEVGVSTYNGYVYITGGTTATGVFTNQVRYAPINANGTLGAWTSTTNLPANRGIHASMAINGFLYIIGGYEGGTATDTVLMAPINANGSVGTWSNTSSLLNPRYYIDAYIYNNYVFVAGGRTTGSAETNSSMYAKINNDGTLGPWIAGTSFTNARSNHTTVINNGYMYITGGWNGSTYYGDVQYASLAVIMGNTQTWTTTTAMNLGVYGHSTVVYNNFVYVIGGYGGGVYRADVRYAPINADGTIGTWTTSPNAMSIVRFNLGAAVYNGYIYATGGQQAAGVFSNTVEYAKINADGTIGTWTVSGNAFTTARYGHVTVAYNGKLYIVGGGDSANVALADVKYASINADGSIGTWVDTTATTAARDTDGFIYGGRLYVLGGVNGTTYSNTVRYATINADGTLGAWTTSGNVFTNARSRLAATAVNGSMYISGGGASAYFGDLQYAQINADGSIGTWRSSNSRGTVTGAPTVFAYHTMIAARGKLIEMGGIDSGNTPQAATYITAPNVPALSGLYSRYFNLGQPSTLTAVTFNAIAPPDQSVLLFRTAGSDGLFGGWQSPSVLSGTPMTNVQYVMVKVSFDDSTNSSLSATAGRSSLADITVDYTVPATLTPDNRLRHNKYFDASGVLQPLQTQ